MGISPGNDDDSEVALDRELTVAIAVSTALWEATIVAEFDDRSDGVVIVRRCVDLADLLATAGAGLARAVLVSPELRHLDRDSIARLASVGVSIVGVIDPDDQERSRRRLADLGLATVVGADSGAPMISQALRAATLTTTRAAWAYSYPAPPDGNPPRPQLTPMPAAEPYRRGSVVAVWGPTGAPGRSIIALTLADEAARLGVPVLLIDADVYGGVIGPMIGLLDEAPGLAAACRQAGAAHLDAVGLARLCLRVRPNLRVLTGISRVDRWPEVRPSAFESVLDAARSLVPLTIIDCGFSLEQDEEITYDTAAPRRNGATFVALEAADTPICVAAADPIGIQRAVRALLELREVLPEVTARLLVNRLRGSVIAGDARSEIAGAFQRFAAIGVDWFVPYDARGVDAALASGRTLAESAANSPIRAPLQALAAELTGAQLTSRRRRR